MNFAASLRVGVIGSLFLSSVALASAATDDKTPSSAQLFGSSLTNSSPANSKYSTFPSEKVAATRGDSNSWNKVAKAMDNGEFNDAIELLSDLIAQNDHAYAAYSLRATCWFQLRKFEKAVSDAQKSIGLNKNFAPPWIVAGLCQMKTNNAPSAIAAFTEAIKIDPTNAIARMRRGFCYIATGKPHEGVADEDVAIRAEPNNYLAYYYRAQGNSDLGNWPAVKADGDKMIKLDRSGPEGHLCRAYGLGHQGNGYEEVAELQQSVAAFRYCQVTDQVDQILGQMADLIPQYAYGKSRAKKAAREVVNAKFSPPADLLGQDFIMETLPPQMRPKPGSADEKTRARWMIGKTWPAGSTITVAFKGGTPEFQKLVADTAQEWCKYGNIRFDFGFNPSTRRYRQWSNNDTSADIRVAFNDNDGHWSCIGMESKMVNPYDPRSMNLSLKSELPERHKAVILHEFGHALGFGHEHQHPDGACDSEFTWEDDPGYQVTWRLVGDSPELIKYVEDAAGKQPGTYTRLIGSFNQWVPEQVDAQMRQLSRQSAFNQGFHPGPVDRKSIMHYGFDPAYFKKGKNSPCCIVEALYISDLDKQGLAKFYPPSGAKP